MVYTTIDHHHAVLEEHQVGWSTISTSRWSTRSRAFTTLADMLRHTLDAAGWTTMSSPWSAGRRRWPAAGEQTVLVLVRSTAATPRRPPSDFDGCPVQVGAGRRARWSSTM